jgi:hypothetical protein
LADYEILKQNLETEMLNWDNLVTELSQIK